MKKTDASKLRPSRTEIIFYVAAAVIALIGLTEATYLTVIALSGETAVCGNSPDCFKVLGSSYAKIGGFPVSGLGALAYFSVFTFATFAAFNYSRARKFFSWTVFAMFAVTLWLLFVQAFRLHAFCRYCLFSAALVFLLTGLVVARPKSSL
ncbi:MAG TPA: vitamin K epoxide reductase family protein [Chthoniobacterales bacterium]|nr:vitamin K epoxide reductase family protein [Chthoniobacterales bacterium]